jgi:hypothetical protein
VRFGPEAVAGWAPCPTSAGFARNPNLPGAPPNPADVDYVNAALYPRRPLLVTGCVFSGFVVTSNGEREFPPAFSVIARSGRSRLN